jgi:hypothetical protein
VELVGPQDGVGVEEVLAAGDAVEEHLPPQHSLGAGKIQLRLLGVDDVERLVQLLHPNGLVRVRLEDVGHGAVRHEQHSLERAEGRLGMAQRAEQVEQALLGVQVGILGEFGATRSGPSRSPRITRARGFHGRQNGIWASDNSRNGTSLESFAKPMLAESRSGMPCAAYRMRSRFGSGVMQPSR